MLQKINLRVLVVDDEKSIRSFLKTSLSSYGFTVFEAANGKNALLEAVSVYPDVIILDLGLPDMDGRDVILEIRKHSKTPIIILSVRDDPVEKINALDSGADDYLSKPFSMDELFARLRAVLRRLVPEGTNETLSAGSLIMDLGKRAVISGGNQVNLSPIEYEMLKLFLFNSGKVLTHQQILRQIWNKNEAFEGIMHLLRVTISNLRGKIEPNPDRPTYILTEPGIGYRLRVDD